MRRAGWAIIVASISCGAALACSSFSSEDDAEKDDAGRNVPLDDGGTPSDAARDSTSSAPDAWTGELFRWAFESEGGACDGWSAVGSSAVKTDTDSGRVCVFCSASAGSSSLFRDVVLTAPGTYTLTGKVHNVSASSIDTRIVVSYGDDAGGSDISPSTSGPPEGGTATMQASRASLRPLRTVSISYRLDKKVGCIEVDDIVLEHTPPQ